MKKIVLGGGCFWCIEPLYTQVKGVESAVAGYAGGDYPNPKYEDLHNRETGHAEVIQITYDENKVSLEQLLEIFWNVHNPTTPNQQGADKGTEYRSILLANNKDELELIEKTKVEIAENIWDNPIITEIKLLDTFYPAEAHHQDYYNNNPQAGYCQIVINPKVAKFREKFVDLLK
jgi:peptide-methionine (S)-S-oxide reductase